jgi:hypothetical protein
MAASRSPISIRSIVSAAVRSLNGLYGARAACIAAGAILFLSLVSAKTSLNRAGEMLYCQGILLSGAPATGAREENGSSSGATAACVNCHRPSGLGTVEGRIIIPPITGKYLYAPGVLVSHPAEPREVATATTGRRAYTDETLARAIREGVGPDGRTLDYLMPRFELDDATMRSLIAYLKELSIGPVPGVTSDTLHFATIITPDADPVKAKGMLDVLEHVFAAKNAFYRGEAPPLQSSWRLLYRVQRKWQLHVWQLAGDPATWGEQLHKKLQAEPVFAAISGIAGKNWEPVHRFCEQESLPCLLPNVALPVVTGNSFYNVYFSKGIFLEAELIAHKIDEFSRARRIPRIVQVFRSDDIGAAAAKSLADQLAVHHLKTVDYELKSPAGGRELAAALAEVRPGDLLVLWLRSNDLLALPAESPKSFAVFVSGLMGGLENAPIRGAWRTAVRLVYPYELPARRTVLMNYPLGWFRIQQIPVVDLETQVNTYIACNILSEKIGQLVDNFVRDYLVENFEVMWSSRIINGYYTRLSLAPGQRFASKGGYIAHFSDAEGNQLISDDDWIVP